VVSVGYQQDMLVIRVEDNGAGAAALTEPAAFGSGINGMRERAASLGGTLSAGPRPGRGWSVQAEFPLPPESASHNVPEAAA
jgi:signal transduction histidine kinase